MHESGKVLLMYPPKKMDLSAVFTGENLKIYIHEFLFNYAHGRGLIE